MKPKIVKGTYRAIDPLSNSGEYVGTEYSLMVGDLRVTGGFASEERAQEFYGKRVQSGLWEKDIARAKEKERIQKLFSEEGGTGQ